MRRTIRKADLAVWRAFITAHAEVVGVIGKEMEDAGQLPLSSYDVLVALSEAPDHRLRMHELARAVILSRSALTRLVDRLVGAGLIVRERCDEDRRGAWAVLTDAGRDALRSAWPVYGHGIQQHFVERLDQAELEVIGRVMSRLAGEEGNPRYAGK